jgi:predicted enzyme related to lactoylglutathione lyase
MDKVQHFEIPADDLERAKAFYRAAFGWKLHDVPGLEYVMADSVETDSNRQPIGGTNSGIIKRNSSHAKVTSITVTVKNIDEAITGVIRGGKKLLKEQAKFLEIGLVAYEEDTEGNVVGLWQSLRQL